MNHTTPPRLSKKSTRLYFHIFSQYIYFVKFVSFSERDEDECDFDELSALLDEDSNQASEVGGETGGSAPISGNSDDDDDDIDEDELDQLLALAAADAE